MRKKKRKRKTPKTSSSRAARTRKSGHSSTSSSVLAVWNDHSCGVMSSVACGSSILLGMLWLLQHSANSVLDCAHSWSYGVKVPTFIRPWWRTHAVLPSMLAGFAGYDAPRAVFPSIVPCVFFLHGGRPMLCGIVVGYGPDDGQLLRAQTCGAWTR